MRFLLIISLMLVISASYAQSSKKNKKSSTTREGKPSSLEPYYPSGNYEPSRKSSKKKDSHGPSYDSQQEYYDRIASLNKTREKNERLAEKPQYSDPMYFGHKRPPKKRKPGKMKYCKECGIRH